MYEVIVIGGGHAGCEASLACARIGHKTLLITGNIKNIADMPCNPSIGGSAKGIVVREIDALGGEMGRNADISHLQIKMLNSKKGPGVRSLRCQADKTTYPENMLKTLSSTPNLTIKEALVKEIITENNEIKGIITEDNERIYTKKLIITTGTYLNADILRGHNKHKGGPHGEKPSLYLSESLQKNGIKVRRLKTGTPPRVLKSTINYAECSIENGDDELLTFSNFYAPTYKVEDQIPCYLTYTNLTTHKIILDNLDKCALYSGLIVGIGPRYCPSIEDKVVKFSDKERHQIFLEPERLNGDEIYVGGFSTTMPEELQEKLIHSMEGLHNAKITKYGYAIEYDAIESTQLNMSLESKIIKGLYTAGQINGTSGYEEAAAQGIVAGINAERYVHGKTPVVFPRDNSYIGVLVDDITTKETFEPYRMMTSRAEHRLVLRQDNADFRLTEIGKEIGLVTEKRYGKFLHRKQQLEKAMSQLNTLLSPKVYAPLFEQKGEVNTNAGLTLEEILRRPNIFAKDLQTLGYFEGVDDDILYEVDVECKYRGYIQKEKEAIAQAQKLENKPLPADINYDKIDGLRIEARQKLQKIRPANLGQAGRISGVSPADVQILIVYLAQNKLG